MKITHRFITVFILTVALFVGTWYVSVLINNKKISAIQEAQERIATDILSSELALDKASLDGCTTLTETSFQAELNRIADKIAFSEKNLSSEAELLDLKKQYALVEVRDFLLVRRLGASCTNAPDTILYFYGAKETCADCARQSYVLDALRNSHPAVRVYSFDYTLDLSIVKAMKDVYGVGETLPALVINGATKTGFQSLEQLEPLLETPQKK